SARVCAIAGSSGAGYSGGADSTGGVGSDGRDGDRGAGGSEGERRAGADAGDGDLLALRGRLVAQPQDRLHVRAVRRDSLHGPVRVDRLRGGGEGPESVAGEQREPGVVGEPVGGGVPADRQLGTVRG